MSRIRQRRLLKALIACGLLTGGCEVGPNYRQPHADTPAAFSKAATTQPSTVDPNRSPMVNWWTSFGDAELNSLVVRALAANHELKIAQSRVLEARAFERIAKSKQYPTIDLVAAVGRARGSAAGYAFPYGLPGMDDGLYQLGFDATYEVDLFGGIRRTIEAAGALAEATEDERRAVQVTLLGEVARNYIGLRTLQRRLAVARANLDDQSQTLEIVTRRFKNGLTTNFDVIRASAQVTATQSTIPPLEAGINQTIYGLSILLGDQPTTLLAELSAQSPIPIVPPTVPVGMPSELLRRRPDIRRAERILAAATAEQGVATSDLFPHLILGGTAGVQSRDTDYLFSQHDPSSGFYLAGPIANWTIFDGGRRWANIDRTKARVAAAASAYEESVLSALKDVESSLTAYSHDQTRRDSLGSLVGQNQEAVRIAKQEYSHGLVNLLDVIEVQRNLYVAQDALAQADQSVSSDLVSLYKALGGGWESADTAPPTATRNASTQESGTSSHPSGEVR
ncbi:MAG TPA: efflux transporter outer membrane subunit [Phycisphaerae bacterium]|nr:efflux transporter outer membrane subunit [Phycisphaerae bacterium]